MHYGPIETRSPLVLSPMAGYTDHPFRLLCKEQGAGLVCTELLSATAMWYGSERTDEMIDFTDDERPVGVQIFGGDPDHMANAARIVTSKGPDFIDVNLGCSVPKVTRTGACSALARDPVRLREVLTAVISSTHLPVSVKMRKGWDEGEVSAPWVSELCQEVGICAVTIHGRTARQGFDGNADWDIVRHVKGLVTIPVLGSGDLRTPQDVNRRMDESECDGVMIGRSAMGNPWFFAAANAYLEEGEALAAPGTADRIAMMRRHLLLNVEQKGERIGVVAFRCQVAAYCKGIPGGNHLRDAIMRMPGLSDVLNLLDNYREPQQEAE
ncbi:MAG TPA: tRNA dihydrouridine synthase DusB [Armatimonadota bacterium]|jgi:tRNA-dihydrouridine synthase B